VGFLWQLVYIRLPTLPQECGKAGDKTLHICLFQFGVCIFSHKQILFTVPVYNTVCVIICCLFLLSFFFPLSVQICTVCVYDKCVLKYFNIKICNVLFIRKGSFWCLWIFQQKKKVPIELKLYFLWMVTRLFHHWLFINFMSANPKWHVLQAGG